MFWHGCVVSIVLWLWCGVFALFITGFLVGVQLVAYVDVDRGHTWDGDFLSEGAMACVTTCNAVFRSEISAHDLETVAAFSATFVDAERFLVVWFNGRTLVPEADWVRIFDLNEELASLSVADKLSFMDWLVASYLYFCLLS
jgi:hypothetical protein